MTTSPEPTMTCEDARAEVHVFLDNRKQSGAKSPELRAHLLRCVDCNSEYRELVVSIARMSSAARSTAETYDAPDPDTYVRRSLIAPSAKMRLRLPRSILPLAIVAVIAILIAKSGADYLELKALSGTVYRGTNLIVAGETVAAENGDGCSTGVDGRAEVALGVNKITFEPATSFSIERLDRLAVRMYDGRARVDGAALILFASGALEVTEGAATVAVDDTGITIESVSGKVAYNDATGRRELTPGTSQHYDHLRMVEVR